MGLGNLRLLPTPAPCSLGLTVQRAAWVTNAKERKKYEELPGRAWSKHELTVGNQLAWDDNLFFGDGALRSGPAQPGLILCPPQLRFSLWVSWTLFSIM